MTKTIYRNLPLTDPLPRTQPPEKLDVRNDPHQFTNLAESAEHAEVVTQMRQALADRLSLITEVNDE